MTRLLRIHPLRIVLLAGLFWLGAISTVRAQRPSVTPGTPAAPPITTTVLDNLSLQSGEIRTLPRIPKVGAWGLVTGGAAAKGIDILMDAPNQALWYPTIGLLSPTAGTIEFGVMVATPPAAAMPPRVLLDTLPNGGLSRIQLALQGAKLVLTWIDEGNQAKAIETNVNWVDNSVHKCTVVWDAADVTLLVDGAAAGNIVKANLFVREPLGLVLGNSRELQSPCKMAIRGPLRLSSAREPQAPANIQRLSDTPSNEDSFKTAQGYDRRVYPLLKQLKAQNVVEVPFAYALAYKDIGDITRAMEQITPIANDPKHPLYLPAVFLRSDLLTDQKDYVGAYEQLQSLASSTDKRIGIRAQVKQAEVLYEQGSKVEAIRLIGEIIARNPNLPEINDAYLVVGVDKFKSGSYEDAFKAFDAIGKNGEVSRQSVAIGSSFDIKVADADLNVRIAAVGLPVTVSAGSGDTTDVILKPAFSRGVYFGSVETALGAPKAGDGILQVRGNDTIKINYIDRLSSEGADKPRMVTLNLATDSQVSAIALAGLAVFTEAQEYQRTNILDENFEVIGTLPNTASKFFRNPQDGTLARKGARFDFSFLHQLKAGQTFHVELKEPDADTTDQPDTAQVEVTTVTGKKLQVMLTETDAHSGIFSANVKTTPEGNPREDMLEVGKNDTIVVRYVDPKPAFGTRDATHTDRISVQMTSVGSIRCDREIPNPIAGEPNRNIYLTAVRVPNGSIIDVNVTDRDLDVSDAADTVEATLTAESGATQQITLTETGDTTGIFSAPVKIVTNDGMAVDIPTFKVKPGEMITASYTDAENMTGRPETREFVFRANIAENATITFARQMIEKVDPTQETLLGTAPLPKVIWEETNVLVPGSMYRVTVTDGDVVPSASGQFTSKVQLKSTSGAVLDLPLNGSVDGKMLTTVFTGNVFVRLGDAGSPARAYFSQTGESNSAAMSFSDTGAALSLIDVKDEEQPSATLWSVPALNLQGKDSAQAVYLEPLNADGTINQLLRVNLRVAADADIRLLDAKGNPLENLKPGMPFELQISDANGDTSARRDTMRTVITSTANDKLELDLQETDVHSGIFSAIVQTVYGTEPIVRVPATDTRPASGTTAPATGTKPAPGTTAPATGTKPAPGATAPATGTKPAPGATAPATGTKPAPGATAPATGTKPAATPTAPVINLIAVPFSGKLTVTYQDIETLVNTPAERKLELATRPLADAEGILLTKVYDDPKFEVETRVRLGESLYAVGAAELAIVKVPAGAKRTNAKLQESARLLQEVIDRFPTSSYVVESLFLTGKIRREEQNPDAEKLFTRVIEEYPDSEFVPQALYQLVLLYYDQDNIEKATESAMRLVYGFPKNSLVADAVLCIAEYYYYQKKEYLTAAFIYRRLIERFPDNPRIDRISYRMATAYYRAGLAGEATGLSTAIRYYLEFAEKYKDHELADDALYWAANAYLKQNNAQKAFTLLTKLLIVYPDGDIKKYAIRLRETIKNEFPNITATEFE